jgi:hypothetical protein
MKKTSDKQRLAELNELIQITRVTIEENQLLVKHEVTQATNRTLERLIKERDELDHKLTQKNNKESKVSTKDEVNSTDRPGNKSPVQALIQSMIKNLITGLEKHLLNPAKNYGKNASLNDIKDDIHDLTKRLTKHLAAFSKETQSKFQEKIRTNLDKITTKLIKEMTRFQKKVESKILPEAKAVVKKLTTAFTEEMQNLKKDLKSKIVQPMAQHIVRLNKEALSKKSSTIEKNENGKIVQYTTGSSSGLSK